MIDPPASLAFSVFENKGVFAVLLGSGVSRAAQIPTGWDIVLDLARRLGTLQGAEEQADWAGWYRTSFGMEPTYSALLDAATSSPDERRALLHRYIEATPEDLAEGRKTPTKAHRAIARLVRDGFVRVVITTNFDRLMENALRQEGVEPTVIASDDDLHGAVPLIHSSCYVIKVHGDYLDTRIRNTEGELQGYSAPMNQLLDRVLDEHGLIVAGWSADWDEALRAAIMRAPSRRYPLFWASRGEPSQIARDLIAHRKGKIVQIRDADQFFDDLQDKIDIQVSLSRTNPRSIELLVASTKRFLAKPEYRIQLHDLVREETTRLTKLAGDSTLGPEGDDSAEHLAWRVSRLEAISEPSLRVFIEMGRWGDGAELPVVQHSLRFLGRRRVLSGNSWLIALMTYPAVLLFYAYGIGALRAGRYEALMRWLTTELEDEPRGKLLPAVRQIFLWDWPGHDPNLWSRLHGRVRSSSALSDHLLGVFRSAIADTSEDKREFERLFERFELMASLTYAGLAIGKERMNEVMARPTDHNYERVPIGRSSWNHAMRESLYSEFSGSELRRQVLGAGFANGDAEFLDLILQNLTRMAKHQNW